MSVVTGIEQASEGLTDLDQKVQKSVIRKAVRTGIKIWLEAARGEAPAQSGKMRKNIKIRNGKTGNGKFTLTVGVNEKDFSGPVFYSAFVLFGHKVGSRKLGDKRKSVPANDFIQRAFEASKEDGANVAIEELRRGIQEASHQ